MGSAGSLYDEKLQDDLHPAAGTRWTGNLVPIPDPRSAQTAFMLTFLIMKGKRGTGLVPISIFH